MSITHHRYGCYVGNIDRTVTVEMLRQVFCQCGTILECSLNGRDEDPYRYGFIDFATEDDRARAMKYNGFTLVGRKLKVGMSKGTINRSDGSGRFGSHLAAAGAAVNNNNSFGHASMLGAPVAGAGAVVNPQQVEAQLLVQLIQQGSMDPRNLTPAQQQLLFNYLSPGGAGAATAQASPLGAAMMAGGGAAAAGGGGLLPPHLMPAGGGGFVPPLMGPPVPPMMMMPPGGGGGFVPGVGGSVVVAGGAASGGGGSGGVVVPPPLRPLGVGGVSNPLPHHGPANPPPTEETVKLREVQRKQFLDVVRKEAERYEKKVTERADKDVASPPPAPQTTAATTTTTTTAAASDAHANNNNNNGVAVGEHGANGGSDAATMAKTAAAPAAAGGASNSDDSSASDSDDDDDNNSGGDTVRAAKRARHDTQAHATADDTAVTATPTAPQHDDGNDNESAHTTA